MRVTPSPARGWASCFIKIMAGLAKLASCVLTDIVLAHKLHCAHHLALNKFVPSSRFMVCFPGKPSGKGSMDLRFSRY